MGDYLTCLSTVRAGQSQGIRRPLVSLGLWVRTALLVTEPLHLTPPEAARSCGDSRGVIPLLYPWHHFATYTHLACPPTLPPTIPPKHICIENQWENWIENLANRTFDEGKQEFLKRKQSAKNMKLQLQTPQALHSLLSVLPLFKQ